MPEGFDLSSLAALFIVLGFVGLGFIVLRYMALQSKSAYILLWILGIHTITTVIFI